MSAALRLGLRETFASFRHRNYRLWFAGQCASLLGTWMQTTAQGYLIFELTHSTEYLGYASFAAGISSWVFMLYGGVIADHMPRRKLMTITQSVMMLLAAILSVLVFTRVVQPWHILVLAFSLGVANAFDAPARISLVRELVPAEDMTNAIALNGTMFNIATAGGPAVGGLVYAWVGPGWCFAMNALSFIAVLAALQWMRDIYTLPPRPQTSMLESLRAGLRYVGTDASVRAIILIAVIVSLFGMVFVSMLPAWAVNVLGGDASTNGILQSARGIGALGGALMIAALGRIHYKGRLMALGLFVHPTMLLLFSAMRTTPLAVLCLIGAGWGQITIFNMLNALLQSLVPDELRGRVMSIYTLTFFGFMPLGALWAGQAAAVIGLPETVALGECVVLAFALLLLWRAPEVRRLP